MAAIPHVKTLYPLPFILRKQSLNQVRNNNRIRREKVGGATPEINLKSVLNKIPTSFKINEENRSYVDQAVDYLVSEKNASIQCLIRTLEGS